MGHVYDVSPSEKTVERTVNTSRYHLYFLGFFCVSMNAIVPLSVFLSFSYAFQYAFAYIVIDVVG